jgi:hypothetical protein
MAMLAAQTGGVSRNSNFYSTTGDQHIHNYDTNSLGASKSRMSLV